MIFKFDSVPLIYMNTDYMAQYDNEYAELCSWYMAANLRPIKFHKEKLGRQNYCWCGSEYRFWIWETDTWRVFVNNRKGICFEVNSELTQEQAIDAWNEYRNRME